MKNGRKPRSATVRRRHPRRNYPFHRQHALHVNGAARPFSRGGQTLDFARPNVGSHRIGRALHPQRRRWGSIRPSSIRGWFSPRSRATPHSRRARGSQPAQALLAAQQKAPAEDRDDFTNIRAVEMLAAGRRLNGMAKSNRIPIVEVYRGIGVHDQQPADRIERIAKLEIDAV